MNETFENVKNLCRNAKSAAAFLENQRDNKNLALKLIAKNLVSHAGEILQANQTDIQNAKAAGISTAMIDRLSLDSKRIESIANSVLKVVALPDPTGNGTVKILPNGLRVTKISVPLGVIGIIYEARPNVTVDAAVLCLKAGNAVVLKGGKEAINSNLALGKIIRNSLAEAGLPEDCVNVIADTTRESANALMKMNGFVDVLIPRGGAGLIKSIVENSTVPVIETGAGNCHIYVEKSADLTMAADILFNAKTSRPSVCNAAEKLLVDKNIAKDFLPIAKQKLDEKNVEIRGNADVSQIIAGVVRATDEDWFTEYNDYILTVKLVDGVHQAVEHINAHNTGHSEAIVTGNMQAAEYFKAHVNAAAVYVNASTRFTDGEEFGLGAEIGISTQKLHARGPMGLEALTTIKYLIDGNGQVR